MTRQQHQQQEKAWSILSFLPHLLGAASRQVFHQLETLPLPTYLQQQQLELQAIPQPQHRQQQLQPPS
jgi:hypothetical protein